jgi:hypothetical protein
VAHLLEALLQALIVLQLLLILPLRGIHVPLHEPNAVHRRVFPPLKHLQLSVHLESCGSPTFRLTRRLLACNYPRCTANFAGGLLGDGDLTLELQILLPLFAQLLEKSLYSLLGLHYCFL